jgi:LysR family transcriptional activator of nhaA
MNVSQSALSVQIQKLEHQVGNRLFERTGKRMTLTEAGKIALDHAESIFKSGEELLSTLRGRPVANRQILRVGAQNTLSRNFQLEFLRPLLDRPDVELILRSGGARELIGQLDAHAVDVVLANRPAPRDAHTTVRNHLLDTQPVSVVGGKRPGRRRFRFPDDLRATPLLLPSPDSDIRIAFDTLMERAGVRPILRAEIDDMAMLRLLAREGKAVALVPPIVVRDELKSGVLVEFCRVPDLAETFYAIAPKRRFPNQLLSQLLGM